MHLIGVNSKKNPPPLSPEPYTPIYICIYILQKKIIE